MAIEKMKLTNKVWPYTILEPINEMTNFVTSHGETKRPLIESRTRKTFVMTTNATLEGNSHRFFK